MYQVPQGAGMVGGPLLHALSIPPHDQSAMPRGGMSPADTIASSLVSPTDSFASNFSPASSHGGPFTPADALRMMSLQVPHKDIPENVDADNDVSEMPFGFWPGETLWANMEGLMPEDFNLGSIPPVELGISQFEAMPQANAVDPNACGDWGLVAFADGEPTCAEEYNAARQEGHIAPEEHDYDDAAATTPSASAPPDAFQGMFAPHEHMNW